MGPPPPPVGPEPPELPPPRQPQPRPVLPDPNQENINPSLRPGATPASDPQKEKLMQGKEAIHGTSQQHKHPMQGGMVMIPGYAGRTQDGDGEPLSKVPRHPNDSQISYSQQPPQQGFNHTGRGSGRGGNPPTGISHNRKGSGRGKNPQTGFTQTGRGSGRGADRRGSGAGLSEGSTGMGGRHVQPVTSGHSQGAPQVPMQQVPHRNQKQSQQMQQMHQMHLQQQQMYQQKLQQQSQQHMYLQQKQQMQQLQQQHQLHQIQQNIWQHQQKQQQHLQQQLQYQQQHQHLAHGNGVVQGKVQTVTDQRFATVQSIPTAVSRQGKSSMEQQHQHGEAPQMQTVQERVGKLQADMQHSAVTSYANNTNHNRTGLVAGIRANTLESRGKQTQRSQAPKQGSQGRPASYQSPGNDGAPSLENRLQQLLEGGVAGKTDDAVAVTNGNTAPIAQKTKTGGPLDPSRRTSLDRNEPVTSHLRQQSVDMIRPKMAHPRKILNTNHQRGASLDSSANNSSNISFNSTTSSLEDPSLTSVSSMEGYDMSSMQASPAPTSPRDVMANIEGKSHLILFVNP